MRALSREKSSVMPLSVAFLGKPDCHHNMSINNHLESLGYTVTWFPRPPRAMCSTDVQAAFGANLVVVEVGEPDPELLKCVRKKTTVPIVVISDDLSDQACIDSLVQGADDFIVKSCSPVEVALRVNAILKRFRRDFFAWQSISKVDTEGMLLDLESQSVAIRGKALSVTPVEFTLLWNLALLKGKVLSKSFIYQMVLGRECDKFDRTIDMHLSRVRKKLSEAGFAQNRIKTVRGQGYCFD